MCSMPMKYNIVLCGNYGAGNLGDELILDGLLKLIDHALPESNITVLSSDPHHTEKLHRVVSIPRLPAGIRSWISSITTGARSAALHTIKHADVFILGGGGLFTDEDIRAVLIWHTQVQAALKRKIPLWCCGQSIGPLKTAIGRSLTQKVFEQAELIIVRDKASQSLLNSWGISHAKVLPDPAFSITSPLKSTTIKKKRTSHSSNSEASPIAKKEFLDQSDSHQSNPHQSNTIDNSLPFITLSLRPWKTGKSTDSLDTIVQFMLWLWKKYQFKTKLLPFQATTDDDVAVMEQVHRLIKKTADNTACVELVPYSSDYHDAMELIGNSQALVGMRLHSLIMSTIVHKPFIALSYSDKVKNFMQEVGLQEYCLDWSELGLEQLTTAFDQLMDNYNSMQKHLVGKQQLWHRQTQTYTELFKQYAAGLKNMKLL